MRVAQAWGRSDVDAFLSELTHDEYLELAAFDQLYPSGWTAMKIIGTRLAFMLAQSQSTKPLKESDFEIRTAAEGKRTQHLSPQVESARLEAYAIRQSIAAGETV